MKIKNKLLSATLATLVVAIAGFSGGCQMTGQTINNAFFKTKELVMPEKSSVVFAPRFEVPEKKEVDISQAMPKVTPVIYKQKESAPEVSKEVYEKVLVGPIDAEAEKRREEVFLEVKKLRQDLARKKSLEQTLDSSGEASQKSSKKSLGYYATMEGKLGDGRVYSVPEEQKTEKTVLGLADALYLEGRGVHKEGEIAPMDKYLAMIAGTVIERAAKGWRGANSVEGVINDDSQYSFTLKDNGQYEISTKARDHAKKNIIDWTAYQKCYEKAREVIENGSSSDIDHFYVDTANGNNSPSWAKGSPAVIFRHKSHFNGKVQDCITRGYNLI